MSERHAYIISGVSREAFQDVGVRQTSADPDLSYYLHAHSHDPYVPSPTSNCNDACQVIRNGTVQSAPLAVVTQMDDANS